MLWISMEFLGLFLRCHFAGKLVVTSQNVGCFLRLFRRVLPEFDSHLELRIFSVFAGDQILFLFLIMRPIKRQRKFLMIMCICQQKY